MGEDKRLALADELALAVGHYMAHAPDAPQLGGSYTDHFSRLHLAYERYCAARPSDAKWPSEVKPQYRSTSAPQALAHLIEEMGEAIAAAGKTMRWGPHSVNPELPPELQEANIDWLARECADVRRAMDTYFAMQALNQEPRS